MPASLSLPLATLLDKAARDNGFDLALPHGDGDATAWLGYASTQCPLRIWLSAADDGMPCVALSQVNVADALGEAGVAVAVPAPARAVLKAADLAALHRLVRRAFQLSRTLPDELLHTFEQRTASLPRTTEAERLVVERVGQDLFRAGLLDYWDGRCAITGLAVPELLRASHIKPWADCDTDAERLDVFNGLLLAPQLDAAFDRGFLTVDDAGRVVVSGRLDAAARSLLALDASLTVRALEARHRRYLAWHRGRVYKDE
jgi:hypothetical protein